MKTPKHLEKFQKIGVGHENFRHIAQNAGHTSQNDGQISLFFFTIIIIFFLFVLTLPLVLCLKNSQVTTKAKFSSLFLTQLFLPIVLSNGKKTKFNGNLQLEPLVLVHPFRFIYPT